jgi:hypothetical protein
MGFHILILCTILFSAMLLQGILLHGPIHTVLSVT